MTSNPRQAEEIEEAILRLLAARRIGATLCPSEVARSLAPSSGEWRDLMLPVRQVAQGLADAGRLRITRGGATVNALEGGGPIRLGLIAG